MINSESFHVDGMKIFILRGKLRTEMNGMIASAASLGTGIIPWHQDIHAMLYVSNQMRIEFTGIHSMHAPSHNPPLAKEHWMLAPMEPEEDPEQGLMAGKMELVLEDRTVEYLGQDQEQDQVAVLEHLGLVLHTD